MTARAAIRVDHLADPFALALDVRRNAIACRAGAGEVALRRHVHEREPIERGIVIGGCFRVRGGHGSQVQHVAWGGRYLRRIDEAVAADPYAVVALRKIGHQISALIVGHHDFAECGWQVRRLGDHPHAGFRAARTGDYATDVIGIDRDRHFSGEPRAATGQRRCNDRLKGNACE